MAEKTGETEKLKCEFDTAAHMEVYLPRLKNWYRTTSNEFRSFDGKRRINGDLYEGPLYQYRTNTIVPMSNTSQIVDSEQWQKHKLISKQRR